MATNPRSVPAHENYDVTIAERIGSPGAWNVEAIDDDGGIEQAIFAGPLAEERARDFAGHRYSC